MRQYDSYMGSFDITFLEALVAAGIPRERAQILTEQLRLEIDGRYLLHAETIATKRDLLELETKLMHEHDKTQERISRSDERISQTNERISISEVRLSSEINSVKLKIFEMNEQLNLKIAELSTQLNLKISQSNERIAETHTRIAETKTETLKWTLGFMVAQTGILFAAITFAA
jgi:hypothetical protein